MLRSMLMVGAGLLATGAWAQQPQVGQVIAIQGCVARGAEAGCLAIADGASGQSYDISSARPRPDARRRLVVRLSGAVTDKMSFCQMGPILDKITWRYTRQRCDSGEQKGRGKGR